MKMIEYKFSTKYFGEVVIAVDNDGHGDTDVKYNNQEINIFLNDYNIYGDKVNVCLEIMDKYVEINDMAKKAIQDNFVENETLKYYFECHFDILEEAQLMEIFNTNKFKDIDINNVVEKLEYPNLLFSIEDNEIQVSVDYMISKEYSDEILCVRMDEKLNITGFSHES
jgi:hypothetical protein